MREIKFRAWNRAANKMFSVESIEWCSEGHIGMIGIEGGSGPDWEFELMQFTGLLDRNGKEVWEGDIVKAMIDFGPGGEYEHIFPVTLGPWGINIQKWNYDEGILPEVIGNIYEHKHLLEEKCPKE